MVGAIRHRKRTLHSIVITATRRDVGAARAARLQLPDQAASTFVRIKNAPT